MSDVVRVDDAEPPRGTRERLIAVAGEMFAAHGLDGTTGKEICERAGVNPAAVNYHFGGLEGLYEAVFIAARERVVGPRDRILELLDSALEPEDKLRAIISLVVRAALAGDRSSWIPRLVGREVTSPSTIGARLLASTARPKLERARALVGELIGRAPDHPSVSLACISIAAPLQLLLIADHDLLRTIHPALDLSQGSEPAMVEHFHRFVMAGLRALKGTER